MTSDDQRRDEFVRHPMKHPLPAGTRVHHRAYLWSYANGGGWGTVLKCVPQRDKTFEYEVQRDEPFMAGMDNDPTWWASYHIDAAHDPEKGRWEVEDGDRSRPPLHKADAYGGRVLMRIADMPWPTGHLYFEGEREAACGAKVPDFMALKPGGFQVCPKCRDAVRDEVPA